MYVMLIRDRSKVVLLPGLRIRIRTDPHQTKLKGRIRNRIWIRIKVISWIWIRLDFQITSQNVRNISLNEHFFKVLSLFLEARIRIWIRIKVLQIRKIPSGFKLGTV